MDLMKEEDILKAIEGVEDIITPAVKSRRERYARLKCPGCGGRISMEVWSSDLTRMRSDEVVPDGRARCIACGRLFDPDTGLVYDPGRLTNVMEAVPLIDPDSSD